MVKYATPGKLATSRAFLLGNEDEQICKLFKSVKSLLYGVAVIRSRFGLPFPGGPIEFSRFIAPLDSEFLLRGTHQ